MPRLNVILHGLAALVERSNEILALLPDVGGQHVFRAGHWYGETDLRSGQYALTGVKKGKASFDAAKNLMLGKARLRARPANKPHATISFPKPLEIHSLRPVKVDPKKDFQGTTARRVAVGKLATVQIFVYEVANAEKLRLGTHDWEPPADPGLETINLHIYSEEEVRTQPDDHPIQAFARAVELFGDVDLRLVTAQPVPDFDPQAEPLPAGVVPLEMEDLADRRERLVGLGAVLRLQDPDPLLKSILTGAPVAAADKLSSCSFPVVTGGGS